MGFIVAIYNKSLSSKYSNTYNTDGNNIKVITHSFTHGVTG